MSGWEGIAAGVKAGLALVYPEVCQVCGEERAGAAEGFVGPCCRSQVKLIEPPFCARCGLPFDGEIDTSFECGNCREDILHFSSARAAAAASGPVLEAIHRYKYHRSLWFEPFLAELLVRRAAPELGAGGWDWIVPVPLHPVKEREREFNQAERLARRLGEATGIPVCTRLLERARATRTQTLLTRGERATNMRGAFVFRARERLEGRRIVLFDDVFTTGATTNACAKLLRKAGAEAVCVWTVARGL